MLDLRENIHPTAVVHPKAKIGPGVRIEPYAIVNSPHIVLEENVVIKSHAYIDGRVHIKEGTTIWPFASIGTQTQNLKYQGEVTFVTIGKNCHIREYVTINSSCGENSKVVIGDNCLVMAYSHIAHNCSIGDHVIMANGATLAGYVKVGSFVTLGGLCAIHQHARVGDYAMVGGGAMVGQDLPPYCIGAGYPLKIVGLNMIGLKRHKFSLEERKKLIMLYRITFQQNLSWDQAKEKIQDLYGQNPAAERWIRFTDETSRGLAPLRKQKKTESSAHVTV